MLCTVYAKPSNSAWNTAYIYYIYNVIWYTYPLTRRRYVDYNTISLQEHTFYWLGPCIGYIHIYNYTYSFILKTLLNI